jgi:hypothetical protein
VSRTSWYLVTFAVIAFLALPGLVARWRAIRRAVGALAVFWVSMNLWGTGLYLLGRATMLSRGTQMTAAMFLALLTMLTWLAWDRRAQGRS